jgi:hypothetical protein
MTLESGHSLHATAFAPHMAKGLPLALASQAPRPTSVYHFVPSALIMVSGYLVVLVVMIVFGVCMGWQREDGSRGGGGGGRKPPEQEPTPPGGRQLTEDSAQPALAGDFAAWEGQLQADDQAVPDRPEDVPADLP